MSADDPYAILGVSPGTPLSEVKTAFRRLARELHPDRNPEPDAEDQFKRIHAAWEAIRDGSIPLPSHGGPDRDYLEAFTDAVERSELLYFEVMLPRYFAAFRGAGAEVAARLASDLVHGTLGADAPPATWSSTRRARSWVRKLEVYIDYRPGWQAVSSRRLRGRQRWRISLYPNVLWSSGPDDLDALVERFLGEQLVSILAVEAGVSAALGEAEVSDYPAIGRARDDQRQRERSKERLFWGSLLGVSLLIPFLAWLSRNP